MRPLAIALLALATAACGERAVGAPPPGVAVQGLQVRSAAASHARALALDPDSRRHGAAVAWLVQHPAAAHEALVRLLEAREPGWQRVPALLSRLGQPEGVAPLAAVVATAEGGFGFEAAGALGQHPDPAATEALVALLASPEAQVVQAALHGLSVRRELSTCPALVDTLGHRSGPVRDAALQASLGMACVPPHVLDALCSDPNPGVALRARQARHPGRLAQAPSAD